MADSLLGITGQCLTLAIKAAGLRQEVAASNIANANSLGYRPLRVTFEQALAGALASAPRSFSASTLASLEPRVEWVPGPPATGAAGSPAVQLDDEASHIVQNVIHYEALLRTMRNQIDALQTVINDGRR